MEKIPCASLVLRSYFPCTPVPSVWLQWRIARKRSLRTSQNQLRTALLPAQESP
jgi:hypothetical protein